MQWATAVNGSEAGRIAFELQDHVLTQAQADHVLPIMASYESILNGVRAEIAEAESKKPSDPDAVYS